MEAPNLQINPQSIALNSISIRNFKGIAQYTLDLRGHNAIIFGDNATGKTSVYDAFLWLLFGKNSDGAADFGIEPIGSRGQGIETVVAATLDTGNGPYQLERRRAENWVKERGSAEATFKGYTTTYAYDGLPMKEAAYKQLIASLCAEGPFKLLTNPRAFPAMKWQDQRAQLFEMCEAVTDQQIIYGNPGLTLLNERGRHSVEDFKRIQVARRKELSEEINKLPVRINEARLAIREDVDIPAAQASIVAFRERLQNIEATMRPATTDELVTRIGRLHLALDELAAENRRHFAAQEDAARNW